MTRTAALALAYLAGAVLSLALTRHEGGAAFIWLPSAPLLVTLLVVPPVRWALPMLACAGAGTIAYVVLGIPLRTAPMVILANMVEAAAGAWLLRHAGIGAACFRTGRGVALFALFGGIVAPAVSGLIVAGGVYLIAGRPFAMVLLFWSASHACGALTVAPISMLVARGDVGGWLRRFDRRHRAIAVAVLLAVAAVTFGSFAQSRLPLLFLPMLPMMTATIVIGRLGAAASTLLLAVIGGLLSLRGYGPVARMDTNPAISVLFFQSYIGCASLLVLPVAALLHQHRTLVRQLLENEAAYRVVAERTGDAMLDVATDGTIRYASPAVAEVVGRSPAALMGRTAADFVHPDDRERAVMAHHAALVQPGRPHDVELRVTDRPDRWLEVSMRGVVTDTGMTVGVIGSVRDVSERKAAERELAFQARTDPLTGLANLRAFRAALDARVAGAAAGGRASVALFDLDRFKAVNDRHGHAAGDAVLRAFADIARTTLRSADCIGRIGGEEFAVLFADVTPLEAAAAGDRLRRALRATAIAVDEGEPLSVTVSVGVATVLPGLDSDAVLRAADSALYRAKASGRDCLRRAA